MAASSSHNTCSYPGVDQPNMLIPPQYHYKYLRLLTCKRPSSSHHTHTHHHLHISICSSLNRTPAPTSNFHSQKHQELGRAARRWRLSTRRRLIRARSLSLLSIQQVKSIMDYDLVFNGCYMWLAPKETSSHASTRVRMRGASDSIVSSYDTDLGSSFAADRDSSICSYQILARKATRNAGHSQTC